MFVCQIVELGWEQLLADIPVEMEGEEGRVQSVPLPQRHQYLRYQQQRQQQQQQQLQLQQQQQRQRQRQRQQQQQLQQQYRQQQILSPPHKRIPCPNEVKTMKECLLKFDNDHKADYRHFCHLHTKTDPSKQPCTNSDPKHWTAVMHLCTQKSCPLTDEFHTTNYHHIK